MDAKRLAIGTVVGGIAMFGATYLIWNIMAMSPYFAFDPYREPQLLLWVAALSNVPFAALVTLVIERGGSSTIEKGVGIGAMVGFLVFGGVTLVTYADISIFGPGSGFAGIEFGIGDGVIAAVLGRR